MALPGRPAPIPPFRAVAGSTIVSPTMDDLNRIVTDLNTQFDAVWAALAVLDARLEARE